MYFDAFDDNPPTTEEIEYLLVDFTDLINSDEDIENAVAELGLNEYGVYDVHAFLALALYLSGTTSSPNHTLRLRSRCFAKCSCCFYLRPATHFCFDTLSVCPVCCFCRSTHPTVTLKTLLFIVDADLLVCYDDVRATILSITKQNVLVALKFGLPIEGLITSTNFFLPQCKPF